MAEVPDGNSLSWSIRIREAGRRVYPQPVSQAINKGIYQVKMSWLPDAPNLIRLLRRIEKGEDPLQDATELFWLFA